MWKAIIWILLSLGVSGAVAVETAHHFGDGWHWERHPDPRHPLAAPEIDPAGAMSGLTLFLGGLAVLRGRGLKKEGKAGCTG
jgi:hypothetical protein